MPMFVDSVFADIVAAGDILLMSAGRTAKVRKVKYEDGIVRIITTKGTVVKQWDDYCEVVCTR